MTITWLGQGCFRIEVKSGNEEVTILTYPFDPDKVGLKLPRTLTADIVLTSGETLPHPIETREGKRPTVIGGPGEYEVKGVVVYAIPLARHPKAALGTGNAEHLFRVEAEHIALVHVGALDHVPDEAELQAIEGLDVLFVPVGGGGVLDAKKAAELTSALEPRLVIPMMYRVEGLKLKVEGPEPFLKAVGTKSETTSKLKLTRKDLPTDDMKVVVLEKA